MASRMYENVKTWNPFVGCRFNCVYCKPSFQRQAKRRRKWCELCYNYEPHFHPERLDRVPNAEVIFACAYGDFVFARSDVMEKIFSVMAKHENKTFYIQTKDPVCYILYQNYPNTNGDSIIPENVILGVTIETNIDEGYDKISKAPMPSERLEVMADSVDGRKYVTIEPILDFDIDEFVSVIKEIKPEFVYIGYDNHNCRLPEPSLKKTLALIEELRKFTEVRLKTMRPAWYEEGKPHG